MLFLETSGLLKLLVQEAFSEIAREAFLAADSVGACAFALTESTGVLHAMHRDGRLSRPQFRKALRELYDLWEGLTVVVPGYATFQAAAELCAKEPLKGADAVHLQAALDLQALGARPLFLTFDRTLYRVAKARGLAVVAVPSFDS
ncbi:type II toxin-antitoxin system VapC family toxin [Thermus caldilimi]|uniref:type II toxin-antitoxin system VapC family toxin n=1 Tax=Thermus caldilimi TaxID=2483360 RepID=UPI001075F827|nr:type II toxin-antitoxin system VapC family toxin [Thermus caldilimi]